MLADGIIEIAPVAYMRGRTLSECFVVIDEAQNCTYAQIKMLLTRLGWRSTMVLTGDPDQTDLLPGISGPCRHRGQVGIRPRYPGGAASGGRHCAPSAGGQHADGALRNPVAREQSRAGLIF